MAIEEEEPAVVSASQSRRTFLATAALGGAGIVAASLLGPQSALGSAATTESPGNATREFLLTMWGMKPYEVPPDIHAPSIVKTPEGLKWGNMPIGPKGAVFATVHHFVPHTLTVNNGDTVRLTVLNLGLHFHGFAIPEYGIDFLAGGPNIKGLGGGPDKGPLRGTAVGGPDARIVTFVADKKGIIDFMCNLPFDKAKHWCNPMHPVVRGQLIVL